MARLFLVATLRSLAVQASKGQLQARETVTSVAISQKSGVFPADPVILSVKASDQGSSTPRHSSDLEISQWTRMFVSADTDEKLDAYSTKSMNM